MVNVQKQFEKAAEIIRGPEEAGSPPKPTQDQQLDVCSLLTSCEPPTNDQFYAHYKQGTEGDCTGAAPGKLIVLALSICVSYLTPLGGAKGGNGHNVNGR